MERWSHHLAFIFKIMTRKPCTSILGAKKKDVKVKKKKRSRLGKFQISMNLMFHWAEEAHISSAGDSKR